MTKVADQLVVGIGSPHGDDQAGWKLIDELSKCDHGPWELRKATVPHDLIDWIGDRRALHIADASNSVDQVLRFNPDDGVDLDREVRGSSHQIGIRAVIDLAATLKLLPECVTVWAIPGSNFRPNNAISAACAEHVRQCAALIAQELKNRAAVDGSSNNGS